MLRQGSIFSFLVLALCVAAPAAAQAPAQVPDAPVYGYKGADRGQKLLAQARAEGTVVLYTSLATTESVPLAQAFEKKTGVKVELWRALSDQIVQRAVAEARARRPGADVIETNGPEMEALARERITAPFFSPYIADIPAWGVPAHGRWVSDRVDYFVVAFNTGKVRREDIPATYEGFLDPKWKGRIGLEATDQEWLAGIAKQWGEKRALDFFRGLVAMKPDVRKGHVLLSGLVAAGEVPVSLTNYASNAESMKRKAQPIDWKAVEPLVGRPQALGLAAAAPHPAAALLFADFLLSPEGQQLYSSMGRFPASRVANGGAAGLHGVILDPAGLIDESGKWQKIWNELVAK